MTGTFLVHKWNHQHPHTKFLFDKMKCFTEGGGSIPTNIDLLCTDLPHLLWIGGVSLFLLILAVKIFLVPVLSVGQ